MKKSNFWVGFFAALGVTGTVALAMIILLLLL